MTLLRRGGLALLTFILLAWLPTPSSAAEPPPTGQELTAQAQVQAGEKGAPAYAARGEQTCLRCHDKAPATNVLHTAHAVKADGRTPFADHQCESCHGASPEHMKSVAEGEQRPLPAVTFGAKASTPVAEQNAVCEGCHQNGARMHWKGSQHQFADVTCVSCHDVHAIKDPVLAKDSQPEVCYDCHKEQRAQSHKPSHHPINEGKVVCSECHNPHGSMTPKLLAGNSVNDTCYQCHAEKRGPLLWEHAPVREDCTICHTPHGSTQANLLKQRSPWLCQQCHVAQFHPSTAYDGSDIPGARQLMVKGCLNCHSQVHGSNHPSGVRNMR